MKQEPLLIPRPADAPRPVRCLSLWQPWASLMFCENGKFIETRGWDTVIRDTVYIHAAKTKQGIEDCCGIDPDHRRAMEQALQLPIHRWEHDLPFGEIIGYGELFKTLPAAYAVKLHPDQEPFGNFSIGRWGHLYRNLTKITPVPCKGKQTFFTAMLP